MKKIFVINGKPKSGKDTFVKMVSKYAATENFSSIEKIKEMALKIGWDGKKDEAGRWFLSELKSILSRYNDLPYKETEKQINTFLASNDEILFIHIREPSEITRIVKDFGAESIIVIRNTTERLSNDSDRYVEEYPSYTYLLDNNKDLKNLDKVAKGFVKYLREKEITENIGENNV